MLNNLDLLHDDFKPIAVKFVRIVREDLGIDARVLETLRTVKRQAEVLAGGFSKNAIGWHQYGRALDFGVFIDGVYQVDDKSGLYLRCAYVGMALGCRTGYNWDQDKNIGEPREDDLGHIEYHPGLTLAAMPPPVMPAGLDA